MEELFLTVIRKNEYEPSFLVSYALSFAVHQYFCLFNWRLPNHNLPTSIKTQHIKLYLKLLRRFKEKTNKLIGLNKTNERKLSRFECFLETVLHIRRNGNEGSLTKKKNATKLFVNILKPRFHCQIPHGLVTYVITSIVTNVHFTCDFAQKGGTKKSTLLYEAKTNSRITLRLLKNLIMTLTLMISQSTSEPCS